MARPLKVGLDYFPLDVDMDQDDKLAMVVAMFGMEGYGVVVKLLMKIYKEGYYYNWTRREQIIFAKNVNVDINKVKQIVNECVNEGFFNIKLYHDFEILTSLGIQMRYLEAVKRRKSVSFYEEYFLITDIKEALGTSTIAVYLQNNAGKRVNVNINPATPAFNANKSTQSKVKESKEENINNNAQNAQVDDSKEDEKELKKKEKEEMLKVEFNRFWSIYPKKTDKSKAFTSFKKALSKSDIVHGKATVDQIMIGTENYRKSCELKGTDKQYIKAATTFLNGYCFKDEFDLTQTGNKSSSGGFQKPEAAVKYGLLKLD